MNIQVVSFGCKYGGFDNANILFDVRIADNPYWVNELKPLCGLDKAVSEYVFNNRGSEAFYSSVLKAVSDYIEVSKKAGIETVTVAFMCTGGRHRSVSFAERLYADLSNSFVTDSVSVLHRDLNNDSLQS